MTEATEYLQSIRYWPKREGLAGPSGPVPASDADDSPSQDAGRGGENP